MKAILRSKSNSDHYYLKFYQMLEFLVGICILISYECLIT